MCTFLITLANLIPHRRVWSFCLPAMTTALRHLHGLHLLRPTIILKHEGALVSLSLDAVQNLHMT
jgi:hypothetical protein